MTIREIIEQGLHYAGTCRSLWLFGFVVALASGGSSGGAGGGGNGDGGGFSVGIGGLAFSGLTLDMLDLSPAQLALIALAIAVALVVLFGRFLGEGALIEGVARTRRGGRMTMGEGFRAGWAHWGVLVRIGLLYFGAVIASVALLAGPCAIAARTLGPLAGVLLGIPA